MNLPVWAGYLVALLTSMALATILTPLARRVALRLGILDQPGGHKSHEEPTPYLGGLAVMAAFGATVTVGALLRPGDGMGGTLAVVVAVALVLGVVGLADDLRGLPVWLRFGTQLAAAVGLWAAGIATNLFPDTTAPDLVITVVWIVGITNACNLLDNMDGLSSGVTAIGAGWFAVIGALNGQFLVAALGFALAGSAGGFWLHNRPPARIYLGDAGSLFLGVTLAVIGIELEFTTDAIVAALIPILVLTVPVLDTTLVVVDRLRHGISPLQGGRDHISHRLVAVGLSVPVAVGTIAVLGVAHGWMALVLSRVDVVTAVLGAGLVFSVDLLLFVLLLRVPIHHDRPQGYVVRRHDQAEGGSDS